MNRAERRLYEKNGVSINTIIAEEKKNAWNQGYTQGRADTLEIIFFMTAYTIQYKLDLDNTKLRTIMQDIIFNIDAFRTGHLTQVDYDTIKKQLIEECNIKLT